MKYFFTILTLLLLNKSINCQTVGLVLSGGGAKGLAHIGVIKALEEKGIPIDYITGTSMGAIVGALYSVGYSPDEMIQKFKSKDFENWSKGQIDDNQKYTVNENFNEPAILNFELKVDSNFLQPVIPSHIVPTQQMDIAFIELFSSGSALAKSNFDSLFVPFRCIASDIENKKQVVFSKGDLGEAVRASMTIPLYFRPLVVNGKILFDGGIYNNFPWKELKNDFNPNFIIGSKVANNTRPPQEDDILLQLENMIVGQTDYQIADTTSVLIETVLNDITLMDFNKIDYIVQEGYNNTIKNLDVIANKISRRVDKSAIADRRANFKKGLPQKRFRNINLIGISSKQKSYISKVVSLSKGNDSLTNLKDNYYKLISEEFIKRLYPVAKYNEKDKYFDLDINAEVKKNLDISLGGNISSTSINQGFISASYYFFGKTANKLYANIYFGRLYSSLDLAYKIKFPSKVPISLETSLVLNRLDYYRSSGDLFFEDVKPSYIIKNEGFGCFEFSFPFSKNIYFSNSTIIGGLDNEYYQIEDFTHLDTPDKSYFTFVNNSTKFEKRTLNKKQYAYRGRRMFFKVNYINGLEEHIPGSTSLDITKTKTYHSWINVKLYNESYHRIISNNVWLGLMLEANYSNKPFFNNSTATLLTAHNFSPSPHSRTLFLTNLRADKYFALGLMPNIRLYKELFLRGEIYSYQPYTELLFTSTPQEIYSSALSSMKFFGSAALVLHTPIGPLSFSLNYYPGQIKEYYLIFNYGFILFNRRALD